MSNLLSDAIVNYGAQFAQQTARYLPEPVASGVKFAASLAKADKMEVELNLNPNYEALINRQIEIQEQLQNTTFLSNIERSRHETEMAPVRNIRVA